LAQYISVSVMHFKENRVMGHGSWVRKKVSFALQLIFIVLLLPCLLPFAPVCSAEVLERVVAYVNDTAITLSEFRENAQKTRKMLSNVSDPDIINSMINRILLLQEAKKIRLEAADDDKLVQEYIDIKIKSAIIIKDADVENFYNENSEKFKGQDYPDARDDIEKYLFEREANKELKKYIDELRAKADIKIQLAPADD